MKPLLLAAIVVAHAAIQCLLVLGDPVPAGDLGFAALTVASVVALILATWAGLGVITGTWNTRGLAWVTGAVVLTAVLSVLLPPLALVGLVLALFVVPAGAAGDPLGGFRAFRRTPVRHVLAILGVVLACVVAWVGALLLGLLVTGVAASPATWLVFGVLGVLVLSSWVKLLRR